MISYYYSVRKAIAVDKNGVRKEETDYERKKSYSFFKLGKRTAYRHNFANYIYILTQWQVARRHDVA